MKESTKTSQNQEHLWEWIEQNSMVSKWDQGLWSPESRTQDSSSRCKSKIHESPKSVKVGLFWKRKHKNNVTGIKRLGPWFWGPGIPPPGILAPLLHHAKLLNPYCNSLLSLVISILEMNPKTIWNCQHVTHLVKKHLNGHVIVIFCNFSFLIENRFWYIKFITNLTYLSLSNSFLRVSIFSVSLKSFSNCFFQVACLQVSS